KRARRRFPSAESTSIKSASGGSLVSPSLRATEARARNSRRGLVSSALAQASSPLPATSFRARKKYFSRGSCQRVFNAYNAAPRHSGAAIPDFSKSRALGAGENPGYNSGSAQGPALSVCSLTICLKQLVWALARAIVPEPHREGVRTRSARLEKAHSLYALN